MDGEGFVFITVGSDFFTDLDAAAAILAQEVCHYLLENNGIRARSREVNERMTDVCMFVCGFGNVFRRGYLRPAAREDYRPGHRLGYLTDQECQVTGDYVAALRRSNSLGLPDELQELRRQLNNRVPDAVRKRMLDHKRSTLPLASEADLYRVVLDDFRHR